MKILVLSSNPSDGDPQFDKAIDALINRVRASTGKDQTHGKETIEINHLTLRNMNLKDCIGCYACWLKSPGICSVKDDMEKVLEKFVKADVVIHASPVKIGFVSPLAKRIRDRLLPLVHPYLKIDGDRMTHVSRYDKLPKQIVVLDKTENTQHIKTMYGKRGQEDQYIYNIHDLEEIVHALTCY